MKTMANNISPIPWTPGRILEATGGELLCGNPAHRFAAVSIDSRTVSPDELFVAIKGENHDGHSFIESVMKMDIQGFVIENNNKKNLPMAKLEQSGVTCIAVENTTKGLGDLARFQKKSANVKLIAITGSNGKTSTRALTASVLEQRYKTLATSGNFNNEIGLPLTLLRLGHEHEWAVVELGMNAPGEIRRLGMICQPDMGIITNIGEAHLEGLGSLDNIAAAKGELIETIKPGGAAILNSDDPMLVKLAGKSRANIHFYGFSEKASVKAEAPVCINEKVSFDLITDSDAIPVELNTPGLFMISNALAAATAGKLAGISAEDIKKGLEQFKPVGGRMNITRSNKGVMVIDDTYNANPDSVMAAISTLKHLKGENRGIVVIGDMFELGSMADELHKKIGAFAAENDVEELYATGDLSSFVADGAQSCGMTDDSVFTGTKKEIISSLSQRLKESDWVLIKGSRSMAMEEIVQELLGNA